MMKSPLFSYVSVLCLLEFSDNNLTTKIKAKKSAMVSIRLPIHSLQNNKVQIEP